MALRFSFSSTSAHCVNFLISYIHNDMGKRLVALTSYFTHPSHPNGPVGVIAATDCLVEVSKISKVS